MVTADDGVWNWLGVLGELTARKTHEALTHEAFEIGSRQLIVALPVSRSNFAGARRTNRTRETIVSPEASHPVNRNPLPSTFR